MRPYPASFVQSITLADGTAVTLRPIRPADAQIEQEFVRNLSDESRYYRFMDMLRELSPRMLEQMTAIDYHDQMALIAVIPGVEREIQIAVGRYVVYPNGTQCEFAIAVADGWQRKGIASAVMRLLIAAARERGVHQMIGEILASNARMLSFAGKLGFRFATDHADPRQIRATLELRD